MGSLTGRLEERLRRTGAAVRASEEQAKDDRATRDQTIEEAEMAGLGIREIARLVQLTPTHVERIVIKRVAERQAGTSSGGQ